MKMIKFLDQKATILVYDSLNQMVLQKLAVSSLSIAGLSKELNVPVLRLWRRIQKLTKAKLVEVTETRKVGNLEQKLYRTTATRFITQEPFEPKPDDSGLKKAADGYARLQNEMMMTLLQHNEIPIGLNPTDFMLYSTMQSFVQVFGKPDIQKVMAEIKKELSNYQAQHHL